MDWTKALVVMGTFTHPLQAMRAPHPTCQLGELNLFGRSAAKASRVRWITFLEPAPERLHRVLPQGGSALLAPLAPAVDMGAGSEFDVTVVEADPRGNRAHMQLRRRRANSFPVRSTQFSEVIGNLFLPLSEAFRTRVLEMSNSFSDREFQRPVTPRVLNFIAVDRRLCLGACLKLIYLLRDHYVSHIDTTVDCSCQAEQHKESYFSKFQQTVCCVHCRQRSHLSYQTADSRCRGNIERIKVSTFVLNGLQVREHFSRDCQENSY